MDFDNSKVDAALAELLRHSEFSPDAEFPVVITSAPGLFEQLLGEVRARGRIRHVLTQLDAVSAWLPLSAIAEFSRQSLVVDLELPGESGVAHA